MIFSFVHVSWFVIIASFSLYNSVDAKGMKCSSHPAYNAGMKHVLIRSWRYIPKPNGKMAFYLSNYVPRFQVFGFAPKNDQTSTKYLNLDLFHSISVKSNVSNFVTLSFQRPATTYIFVRCKAKGFPSLSLPGWNSEGWAKLVQGDRKIPYMLGVQRKRKFFSGVFSYVFSKVSTNDEIKLPGRVYIENNLQGTTTKGMYWALIAEGDGSASHPPANLNGVPNIPAGGRCPDELHELWKSPDRPAEPGLNGATFKAPHPLWDPCFWCAYDHEHGSIPQDIMNYHPRLGYVALKNNNQNESHNGFKALMLRTNGFLFYYGIHAHLSQGRRFDARTHTVVFAVVKESTKELMLELGHKGDFGFLAVRIKPKGNIPVSTVDAAIKKQLMATKSKSKRLVNVINVANLNQQYAYNKRKLLRGRYEQWFMTPMCSKLEKRGIFKVDFQTPNTALKEKGSPDIVKLGRSNNNIVTLQHNGIVRTFRTDGFTIGENQCGFSIPSGGYFYTDTTGKILRASPGPNSIRQFIKPGFELIVPKGKWRATDTWIGVHEKVRNGRMFDVGAAVNPEVN